jgi:hypothetical protein
MVISDASVDVSGVKNKQRMLENQRDVSPFIKCCISLRGPIAYE